MVALTCYDSAVQPLSHRLLQQISAVILLWSSSSFMWGYAPRLRGSRSGSP